MDEMRKDFTSKVSNSWPVCCLNVSLSLYVGERGKNAIGKCFRKTSEGLPAGVFSTVHHL